ncbi:MAG: hypothetical protein JSS37_08215 [Proteobacteria bacterium]|nr:hypothetical protein [Pseudomonadota bacterium]
MSENNKEPDSNTGYSPDFPDGTSYDPNDPYDACFDKETRSMLFKKLHKAIVLQGNGNCSDNVELLINEIIDRIEMCACYSTLYKKWAPGTQQRRRERIESIANHLDGIIDQLNKLDTEAIKYILMSAYRNPPAYIGKYSPDQLVILANRAENTAWSIFHNDTVMNDLLAYASNFREAAKTLPMHKLDSPEFGIAVELELLFRKYGIKFTVTNTGLAADCLREIYNLAGLQIDRVDYWLKRARDSEHPLKNCYSLPQKTHEK